MCQHGPDQASTELREGSIYVSVSAFLSLVIFDIDGTLTTTMKADEECYVRSLSEVCGFNDVDTDWSRYKHATDAGIFHEIHESRTGRAPSAAEVSRVRDDCLHALSDTREGVNEAVF